MYTDDTLLTFGKHRFTKLCRVPADYLLRFLTDGSQIELKEYVSANLEKILMRQAGIIAAPLIEMPCKKIAYVNEKEAKFILARVAATDQEHKKPIRCYECPKCGAWHLTSKPL